MSNHPSTPILSHDVRYALTYRDAYVSPDEILGLFPGMSTLGVYGVAKFLHIAGRLDRLPPVIEAHLWGDCADERHEAATALSGIDFWVRMPKLEEHSRRWSGNRAAYAQAAQTYATVDVYLLGLSTIPGIKAYDSHAIKDYDLLFKPLQHGHTIPKVWPAISIDPVARQVGVPRLVETLAPSAVVVDDIRNTGATEAKISAAFPDAAFAVVNG